MNIDIYFDHIDDAEIEVVDIDKDQEEKFFSALLNLCYTFFDRVEKESVEE